MTWTKSEPTTKNLKLKKDAISYRTIQIENRFFATAVRSATT